MCPRRISKFCGISLIIPNCKKIIIGSVYRPPQGNVKKCCDYTDDCITKLKETQNVNHEVYIMGDFNINYKATTSQDTKTLKWLEQRTSLKQIITEYSRY